MAITEAKPEAAKKPNHHIVVALRQLNKRRDALLAARAKMNKEIEKLDASILTLEGD